MRKAFDRQRRLDCPAVRKVSLNLNCRNETIASLIVRSISLSWACNFLASRKPRVITQ
jgi:hypothetical protein